MANAKDGWVIQSPKTMPLGEAIAYTFDFFYVGTPEAVGTMTAYDADGTDKSSTVLGGSTSIVGDTVVGKLFTPDAVGNWRLVVPVTITGNTVISMLDVAVYNPVPAIGSITSGSYGDIDQIAAIVPKHASRAGSFDDTTRPTGAMVATFIDQMSALLNSILSEAGFSIPVTNTSVKPMLDMFVNQEVAAMVEGINGSGRYGPQSGERKSASRGRFEIMLDSVRAFVEANKNGMERMGASRSYSVASGIMFRGVDESGQTPTPLFQRKAFGETYQDWDD